ncbi:MAG: hypothetical protein KF799_04345 [Bdellovibrionales bacterium]|nr:hypothetical protein [Bdellovibrionales bacterium]
MEVTTRRHLITINGFCTLLPGHIDRFEVFSDRCAVIINGNTEFDRKRNVFCVSDKGTILWQITPVDESSEGWWAIGKTEKGRLFVRDAEEHEFYVDLETGKQSPELTEEFF